MSSHLQGQLSTLGGTLLTIWFTLDPHDLLKTILLAMVGALVSFITGQLLQRLKKKVK